MKLTFNIVLLEPEIPQNTGNIVRTAVCTGARLHLIEPFGFEISDKTLKRAGLDYWSKADISYYKNFDEFKEKNSEGNFYYFTTKGQKKYSEVKYEYNDFLIFGKESKGIPEEILQGSYDKCVRVPMKKELRSLNLANVVALAVYEAFRQKDFENFEIEGHLTQY